MAFIDFLSVPTTYNLPYQAVSKFDCCSIIHYIFRQTVSKTVTSGNYTPELQLWPIILKYFKKYLQAEIII